MKTILLLVLAAAAFLATACSKSTDHEKKSSGRAHVHTAPHGGTLVEIGEHAYNLELLRDPATGKLTAWVLDGHAENFVRIAAPSIALIAMPGGQYTPLTLKAVANPSTGETVGDTSQFEIQADWLKTAGAFSGIFTVEIKGTVFKEVAFSLGAAVSAGDHDHGQASGEKKKKKPKPHDSPRGGTLVEVGEHEFNADLVLDRATGTLHAWILGAHAKGVDDRVRIAMPSFEVHVTVAGRKQSLVFQAKADPATGEKPGNTSVFAARSDWLRTATTFDGVFPKLVIAGETFAGTTFNFPKGRTHP
jgi:hypothetical protein